MKGARETEALAHAARDFFAVWLSDSLNIDEAVETLLAQADNLSADYENREERQQ